MMEGRLRHTFSRDERLKLRGEFRRCIQQGGRAAGTHIIVYVAGNDLGLTRLGAASTKRLGGAVRRNRGKRLVREAFRLVKHDLPLGIDLVVIPKTPWRDPSLEELKADLIGAVGRAAKELERRGPAGK